eukprot:13229374-Alexandrium_andersonii.AAC.1
MGRGMGADPENRRSALTVLASLAAREHRAVRLVSALIRAGVPVGSFREFGDWFDAVGVVSFAQWSSGGSRWVTLPTGGWRLGVVEATRKAGVASLLKAAVEVLLPPVPPSERRPVSL